MTGFESGIQGPSPATVGSSTGSGTGQIKTYVTDPNSEGVLPDDQTKPAVAYKSDGSGALKNWVVATLTWALFMCLLTVRGAQPSFQDLTNVTKIIAAPTNIVEGNVYDGDTNHYIGTIDGASGFPAQINHQLFSQRPARYYNNYLDNGNNLGTPNNYLDWRYLTNVVWLWKTNGMLAAGYDLIWIDDGEWIGTRTAGVMDFDTTKISAGLAGWTHYCHSNGFRAGIYDALSTTLYNTPGYTANASGKYMNWMQQQVDAYMFAQSGVDAVKLDYTAGLGAVTNPRNLRNTGQVWWTRGMCDAILESGRPMLLLLTDIPFDSGWYGWDSVNGTGNNAPSGVPNSSAYVNILITGTFGAARFFDGYRCFTNALPHMWQVRPGHSLLLADCGPKLLGTNALKEFLTWTYMASAPTQISDGTNLVSATTGVDSLLYLTNQTAMSVGNDVAWIPGTNQFIGSINSPQVAYRKPLYERFGVSNAVALVNVSNNVWNAVIADTNMGWPAGSVMHVIDTWTNGSGKDVGTYTNNFSFPVGTSNSALLIVTRQQWFVGSNIVNHSTDLNILRDAAYTSAGFHWTNTHFIRGSTAGLSLEGRDNAADAVMWYVNAHTLRAYKDGNEPVTIDGNSPFLTTILNLNVSGGANLANGTNMWVKQVFTGGVKNEVVPNGNRFGPISGFDGTNTAVLTAMLLPKGGYLTNFTVWDSTQLAATTNIVFTIQTNSLNSTPVDGLLTCTLTGTINTNDATHSVILTTTPTIGVVRYVGNTAALVAATVGWSVEWWHQSP